MPIVPMPIVPMPIVPMPIVPMPIVPPLVATLNYRVSFAPRVPEMRLLDTARYDALRHH
jgi:hypothetical protein